LRISVIGLGKIGLPLAVQYASMGNQVTGLDVNAETVSAVNAGRVPFPGEHQLPERLSDAVAQGQLSATTSYAEAIPGADVVVVVVPLLVDAEFAPDFTLLDGATAQLGAHLTPGTLIAYETTLPVGTTRGRWRPMLEAASGLVEGSDFDLVFSPERVLTGRVFQDLRRYPKLVGALSPGGASRAVEFYGNVLEFDERSDLARANGVWDLGTAEAAEFAKLAETTYRDVNIGLANEFARAADKFGVDIYSVIEACNSQPYSHLHRPGIAVGGHCIPVYPRLYLHNDPDATIVAAARTANEAMPAYACGLLKAAFGGSLAGQTVVVLGAAYRGGVKETAVSGVFAVVRELKAAGATPLVHDPLYSDEELTRLGLEPYPAGTRVDAAILQAEHEVYRSWGNANLPGVRVLLDGRNVTDADNWPGVTRLVIGNVAVSRA
jgi:nucleotide sugar dehydrogenase